MGDNAAKVRRFTVSFAVAGSVRLDARERRVHVLQRLEHVHVPVEETD